MKIARLYVLSVLLLGCAQEQEVWSKVGLNQAELNQDYAACQLMSLQTPEIHHETDVYTSRVVTIGNQTTVSTGPDPYAQLGTNLRDAIDNDDRQTAVRHYCMQAKGYAFTGTRPVPQ